MSARSRAGGALCAALCLMAWVAAGAVFAAFESRAAAGSAALWALRLARTAAQGAASMAAAHACGLDAESCGFCPPRRGWALPALCCAAIAALAAFILPAGSTALPEGGAALALAFLQLCPAPAIAEEVLFRGIIPSALRREGRAAIVIQAAAFALLHSGGAQRAYAFAMALALGWMAERSKSVWPGVAVHCANNILAFMIDIIQRGMQ